MNRSRSFGVSSFIHYFGACLIILALAASPSRAQPCPSRCGSCRGGLADCAGQSLTAPPRTYPLGTRILDLKGNYIRLLGSRTFQRLASLEILKVNSNRISSIRHFAFRSFPNLASIDLSQNKINRISTRAFNNMPNLRTLSLNRNRIHDLSTIFSGTPNLYQLNLAKNRISRLGQYDFYPLTRVHYLDLRNNRISSIHPRAFENMIRLRYLFIANNPINRRLPNLMFSPRNLQMVDFSSCRLPSVPKTFPTSLSDFRLRNNRITQINFTDFTAITDLQLLALNDNQLYFFADGSLSHLDSLKEVWLRRNRLGYVPRDLPSGLQRLHMDSNHIQEIEAGLFSPESRLDFLTVENNQIHRLQPNTFTGMRYLNILNFQGNNIHTLERNTFTDLGSLQTILLSNNPLVRMEDGAFRNMANLTSIYLSYISQNDFQIDYNFLAEMPALRTLEVMASPALAQELMNLLDGLTPETMVTLEGVTTLDLSFNTLEHISPKIRSVFPNLESLPLDGNPFRCTSRLKWLKDWMLTSNVAFHKYEELMCDSPPNLYGRFVLSLADGDWGRDNADRSQEILNADVVNQHAALLRDMPGRQDRSFTRSSNPERRTNNDVKDSQANSQTNRGQLQSPETSTAGDASLKKPNLLKERANREERRKKRRRSKSKRRGYKGKKNRKKGKKRKNKKGRKKTSRNGRTKRNKRVVESDSQNETK